MSLTETDFCFSPSALRKAASSKVSSGGGVRLRLAALGFPCGARNDMLALYTKHSCQGCAMRRTAQKKKVTFNANSATRGEANPNTPVPAPTRNKSLWMLFSPLCNVVCVLLIEPLPEVSQPFVTAGGWLKFAKLKTL